MASRSRWVAPMTRTSTLRDALAADRAHLAVLQDAQQLGLHRERHLADLVEEERPAVGDVEEAGARRRRAGEGAAHVPEERRLEERLGDARAVLADEGPPRRAARWRAWRAR